MADEVRTPNQIVIWATRPNIQGQNRRRGGQNQIQAWWARLAERTAVPAGALLIATLMYLRIGGGWTLLAILPWTTGLIMLAERDLRHHQLPKRIANLTGIATASALTVCAAATDGWTRVGVAGLWTFVATCAYGALWLASPQSFGFGDVRLVAVASLMLGWLDPRLALIGLVAGQFTCLVAVAILAATKRLHRRTEMPLGAFIALASLATALVFGR